MAIQRTQKLVPWYFKTKDQCEAVIKRTGEQCISSATWKVVRTGVKLCKTHADMMDEPTTRIREKRVILRSDTVSGRATVTPIKFKGA